MGKSYREIKVSDARISLFLDLTDREREILDHIAWRDNNSDMAQNLHISPQTASNHISNIFNKLHVADRTQAIVRARDAGLGCKP